MAKISAAHAPDGPPPMTATRIGRSMAMLTAGLRACCAGAKPATREYAVEGRKANMMLCCRLLSCRCARCELLDEANMLYTSN